VPEHGFTDVDGQPRPRDWVRCLDALAREPFYREYKAKLVALLDPRASGHYLDLGCGVGDDARRLRADVGARVVGLDASHTLLREALGRGLESSLQADAHMLPLRSAAFDGVFADRVFQHLADPDRALAEVVRVLRPGGRVVLADPDYSTQPMNFPDRELARDVFQFRAYHGLRNGTLAGRMADRLRQVGLRRVEAQKLRLDVRDPSAVDHVMGLRSWARTAAAAGEMTRDRAERWEQLYDENYIGNSRDHYRVWGVWNCFS
jgi:SAM-dependent methyltransferase